MFIGQKYRFRVINAAMTFAFRVSIDGHMLNVIATDGNDVVTKQVESFIISGGERYDFWIEVTNPQKLGNYWIRAETLEMYQNEQVCMEMLLYVSQTLIKVDENFSLLRSERGRTGVDDRNQ